MTYNSAKLAERNRMVETVDDIIRDFMAIGHAIIPLRLRGAVVGRLRAAGVRFNTQKLDERRVKVTPKKE